MLGRQLGKYHGQLTPEIAIRDVVAITQTGDVHVYVTDLVNEVLMGGRVWGWLCCVRVRVRMHTYINKQTYIYICMYMYMYMYMSMGGDGGEGHKSFVLWP